MLFPEGLGYDFENDRVRTFRVNSIFNVISSISDKKRVKKKRNQHYKSEDSALVTAEGFEPPTLRAEI